MDAFNQFQFILNAGITLVTLINNTVYTKKSLNGDFSQLLISLSIMYRANEESETKSGRIRNGLDKVRSNLGNFKLTANCPQWLKLSEDRTYFKLREDRVDIVKKIFSMSFDGVGIKTITRILNQDNIPTVKSKSGWCQSTVRKILSSRAVIGEFQPHSSNLITKKSEPVGDLEVGYFPAIIDVEMFNAVQARLANGTHIAGRTAKVQNLFSGITKCGYCGARMDVVTKGKIPNEVRNLVCDNARRGFTKCGYTGLKCNELEYAFIEYCREKDVLVLMDNEMKVDETNSLRLMKQMSSYEEDLCNTERKINNYLQDVEEIDDKLVRDRYMLRITELLHCKEKIQQEMSSTKNEIESINASIERSDTKVKNILDLYERTNKTLDETERLLYRTRLRNELRLIVKKLVVYPRGRVYSDKDIVKVEQVYSNESQGLSQHDLKVHLSMRDDEIEDMKLTQNKTTDDRFFEIYFKNGNYRHIAYSPKTKTYQITMDRMGDTVDWWNNGKKMQPLVRAYTASQIKTSIDNYRTKHAYTVKSDEEIESMIRFMSGEGESFPTPI